MRRYYLLRKPFCQPQKHSPRGGPPPPINRSDHQSTNPSPIAAWARVKVFGDLLARDPWYLLRPVAVWALVRRRSPRKFFLNLFGKRSPDFLLWETYRGTSVEGVDGTLGLTENTSGFLEMTHESVITPELRASWEALAKEKARQT
jgi:hypothetical protein